MSMTIAQKAKKYGFRSVNKYKEAVKKARALRKELHKKPRKPRKSKLQEPVLVIQKESDVTYIRTVPENVYRKTGKPYEYFDKASKSWLLADRELVMKLEKKGKPILWSPDRTTASAEILKAPSTALFLRSKKL